MQRIKFGRRALWASLVAFILGLPALAQNATGTLVGHVTDASGAVIPNANVTVTNVDTGEAKILTTNEAGDYTAPLLKPGNYRVTVSAAAFNKEATSGIVLNADQTASCRDRPQGWRDHGNRERRLRCAQPGHGYRGSRRSDLQRTDCGVAP